MSNAIPTEGSPPIVVQHNQSNSNNQWSLLKKNPQGQDTLDKMISIVVNKDNNPLIVDGYTSTQTKLHIKIKHHEQHINNEQDGRCNDKKILLFYIYNLNIMIYIIRVK